VNLRLSAVSNLEEEAHSSMARFKVCLEYLGTRYSGWQIQKNARTVQGEIQQAIQRSVGTADFEFYGAGRTDAGVHALAQVAHLDIKTDLTAEQLRRRINAELPSDIQVLRIDPAPPRFHARHHAVARSYLYQITRRRTAFGKKLVWWIKEDLDLARMREAGALFVGMKNYQSFTADEPGEKSTHVLVDRVELRETGDLILIRVEGSHFLWRMVRRVVGVIAEAGRGNLSLEEIAGFLRVKTDKPAQLAAPASGLFLERVYYEGDPRPVPLDPVLKVTS
jgi:tRNA pseudouridine38-40 synthase